MFRCWCGLTKCPEKCKVFCQHCQNWANLRMLEEGGGVVAKKIKQSDKKTRLQKKTKKKRKGD